ncbi:MAG: Superoxide dismutase [Cu-Zn] precursor (EC [uncultured Caballeronia sp.]|nr:MAG: Superoxide dismutase [Cu-Zn] precursor (EC [uncultured Caballeronia sp.]
MKQRFDGPESRRLPAARHPVPSLVPSLSTTVSALVSVLLLGGCGLLFQNHEKRADATLQPTGGNTATGTVTFIERADGVQVSYNLSDMPPNSEHALQIHEHGDCIITASSDGGPAFASERSNSGSKVEGDLASIRADANGTATGFIVAPDVSLDGVRSVLSRAIVLHRDAANTYAIVPHGASPALACGVIKQ